jgi:hypothetical protein
VTSVLFYLHSYIHKAQQAKSAEAARKAQEKQWEEQDLEDCEKLGWPGNDPNASPGEGWEKRGPNWFNPQTNESLHPDLNHPAGIPPHWDYKGEEWD